MRKICYKPENAIHDISGMPYLLTVNRDNLKEWIIKKMREV